MKKFNLYLERVRDFINEDIYYFFESQDKMIQLMNEILSIIQGSYGEDGSKIKGSYEPDGTPKPNDNTIATISSIKDLESRWGVGISLNPDQRTQIETKYNEVFKLLEQSIVDGENAIFPINVKNFFTGMNILHQSIEQTGEALLGDSLEARFNNFLNFIDQKLNEFNYNSMGIASIDIPTTKSYLEGLKILFKNNPLIVSEEKKYKEILKRSKNLFK